ncbi:MAG: hypothetical protein ACPG4W_03465 [Flavobacteriales bacterium]
MLHYVERQYLGKNRYSLSRRLILTVFCFISGYWLVHEGTVSGKNLYYLGGFIALWSFVLLKVLHFKTVVNDGFVELDGLWSTRKVKIDLNSIESIEQAQYNPIYLKHPVYNLHRKNRVHFYTYGTDIIVLKDRSGTEYLIGSQTSEALEQELIKQKEELTNNSTP